MPSHKKIASSAHAAQPAVSWKDLHWIIPLKGIAKWGNLTTTIESGFFEGKKEEPYIMFLDSADANSLGQTTARRELIAPISGFVTVKPQPQTNVTSHLVDFNLSINPDLYEVRIVRELPLDKGGDGSKIVNVFKGVHLEGSVKNKLQNGYFVRQGEWIGHTDWEDIIFEGGANPFGSDAEGSWPIWMVWARLPGEAQGSWRNPIDFANKARGIGWEGEDKKPEFPLSVAMPGEHPALPPGAVIGPRKPPAKDSGIFGFLIVAGIAYAVLKGK